MLPRVMCDHPFPTEQPRPLHPVFYKAQDLLQLEHDICYPLSVNAFQPFCLVIFQQIELFSKTRADLAIEILGRRMVCVVPPPWRFLWDTSSSLLNVFVHVYNLKAL